MVGDVGVGVGGLAQTRQFDDARVSNVDGGNLEVTRSDTNFAMNYSLSGEFGVQIDRWMRIGLRIDATHVTDYGTRWLFAPSGGISATFGWFPQ